MLEHLRGRASERRLRLFASACCRGILSKFDPYHGALNVSEGIAEGKRTSKLLRGLSFWSTVASEAGDPPGWAIQQALDVGEYGLDGEFTDWVAGLRPNGKEVDPMDDLARFADLARCVFGNPFRPVAANPAWLTSTVVTLVKQMYEKKTFDAMPILADALQDAGCEEAELLDHCRGGGPHCRGCWVLDLVLGK
jgi:hypothetical protein